MSDQPAVPVNVRLQLADGTIVPIELVYIGQDKHGIYTWTAVPTSPVITRGSKLLVEQLPGRTAIHLLATL